MPEQQELFYRTPDICRVRHRGNPKSEAANERIHERKWPMRKVLYGGFITRGAYGATCDELENLLQIKHQTCSARIAEMCRDGQIVNTGQTRPTSSGSMATVYVADKFAKAVTQ